MHMAHHIPIDLIILILVKLPVKSLLRFKSVCKIWKSIINDPSFIECHLISHQREDDPQIIKVSKINGTELLVSFLDIQAKTLRAKLLVSSLDIQAKANNSNIMNGDPEAVNNNIMKIHVAEQEPLGLGMLPYSCNGIICFHGVNHIYLCNPSTGEFRTLPQGNLDSSSYCGGALVGFGRDEITKKYKLVRFCPGITLSNGMPRSQREYEVLTLDAEDGSSSWRNMGSLPSVFLRELPFPSALLVGGALYFLTCEYDEDTNKEELIIVAFDLHTEKFRSLSSPPCYMNRNKYSCCGFDLLNIGGFLCLTDFLFRVQTLEHSHIKFWIMKNSTAGTVWEKLYEIDLGPMDRYPPCFSPGFFPVLEHKNKTVSFCPGGGIFYNYDPRSGRVVYKDDRTAPSWYRPFGYVQSLVPLFETRASM